jgi:pimeloyl-ACP methyl ester carboxylesterase
MFFSLACSEDAPLVDRHAAAERARGTVLGTYWVDRFLAACAEWPKGAVPADYRTFAPARVPALLVSGYLDDATPPHRVGEVLRLFPNSRSVVVRNGSHSFSGMRGCVDLLIAAFYEAGSAAGLDDSCAAEIRRPPFAVGEGR